MAAKVQIKDDRINRFAEFLCLRPYYLNPAFVKKGWISKRRSILELSIPHFYSQFFTTRLVTTPLVVVTRT